MELLHKGFDGLDLAYAAHLPAEHTARLDVAKALAVTTNHPAVVSLNGVRFNVASTGARGGYAFRCDTGALGETWFFKKPSTRDPWGIRVSVSAVRLALKGLHGARTHLEEILHTLGVSIRSGSESISRIDFAMDFLIPDFELVADNFVMGPRFKRMTHGEMLVYKDGGHTGRTESVTIGKNPGRQIIVYDKRAEVLNKGKSYWPEIWNSKRATSGIPPLDLTDPALSRVWRVELRAYKRHLKDDWNVSSWMQLQEKLSSILESLVNDIRYTTPTSDSNRSRWLTHRLWQRATEELQDDLSNLTSFASEDHIQEILRAEQISMITKQIAGCLITLAALRNITPSDLASFVGMFGNELIELFRRHPEKTLLKLSRAKEKYE